MKINVYLKYHLIKINRYNIQRIVNIMIYNNNNININKIKDKDKDRCWNRDKNITNIKVIRCNRYYINHLNKISLIINIWDILMMKKLGIELKLYKWSKVWKSRYIIWEIMIILRYWFWEIWVILVIWAIMVVRSICRWNSNEKYYDFI
jgi:hypothetical protein